MHSIRFPHWHRMTRRAQAWLLVGLLIAVASLLLGTVSAGNDTLLEVHFIDVGQGDATLIIAPDGAAALIDGGLRNDMALDYLQGLGLDTLDVIVATHPDQDHIAGLLDIMPAFEVGGVWQPGSSNTTLTFGRFLTTIAEQGIPFHDVGTGDTIPLGELTFDVLWGVPEADELNNTSLVLRLELGDVSFLFTADAERPVEQTLVDTVVDQLPTTVLKMGHHGSSSSSSVAFVNAVSPEVAVYSAGLGNPYGHPHTEALANLDGAGAAVFGTDVHGTVVIVTDGETFSVIPTRDEPPVVGELGPEVIETAEPVPTAELRYDPFGPDRDCGEFETHAEAQAFFEAAGGPAADPHSLDGNNDGIACESLP